MSKKPLADGIYLGLPDADYHADLALGSTGLKKLLVSAYNYWWESPLNPDYARVESDAIILGKALHKRVCEGETAFKALHAEKKFDGRTAAGRAEKEEADKTRLQLLSFDNWALVNAAPAAIAANTATAQAFTDGLPEVSVFWTRPDGIRCKARFDYFKQAAIVDLKSFSNSKSRPLGQAALREMAERDYPLSAAWYLEGRRHMPALLDKSLVFGGTAADIEFLRHCAKVKSGAFVWVFYQTENEPAVCGIVMTATNNVILAQHAKITLALSVWQTAMERWGGSQPWIDRQPELLSPQAEDFPKWYLN